jgi:hypothetical protein
VLETWQRATDFSVLGRALVFEENIELRKATINLNATTGTAQGGSQVLTNHCSHTHKKKAGPNFFTHKHSSIASLARPLCLIFPLFPACGVPCSKPDRVFLDKSHSPPFIESQSFQYNSSEDQLKHNNTHTSQQKPQNKASSSN